MERKIRSRLRRNFLVYRLGSIFIEVKDKNEQGTIINSHFKYSVNTFETKHMKHVTYRPKRLGNSIRIKIHKFAITIVPKSDQKLFKCRS